MIEKASISKAFLNITLVVSITSLLSYPSSFWYVSLLGGLVLIAGVFFKLRSLVTLGVVVSGGSFYFSNLLLPLSMLNVALFIGMLVFLYASIIYINEMIKRDIIRSNYEGDIGKDLEEYLKHWRLAALKNFSIAFILSLLGFIVIRKGTFNFWIQLDNLILLGLSAILVFSLLILLYFLFLVLPNTYSGEESRD